MRGQGNRRRGATRAVGVSRAEFNALKHKISGRELKPSVDPPAFVVRPWNSYTYEASVNVVDASTEQQTTLSLITARIRANMGIATAATLEFKIQKAYVWATSQGPDFTRPGVDVRFCEISSNGSSNPSIRSQQQDIGTLNMPAHVGYEWPSTDSKEVLRESQGTDPLILRCSVSIAPTLLTQRLSILWRVENVA